MTVKSSTLIISAKPNGRLGSRKSKTGCITCKSRKVKCDQAKPYCNRCRNADRKCAGYEDVFVSTQSVSTKVVNNGVGEVSPGRLIFRSPVRDAVLSPNEERSFDFYTTKVGMALGGASDIRFWNRSLLRLGESEPAIKYFVVTVSNLFETQTRLSKMSPFEIQEADFKQGEMYNKALNMTAERLKQPDPDVVALATCGLLLAYFVMQGDEEQAVHLYKTGADVIKKLLIRACSNQYAAGHEVAGIFLSFFERLAFAIKRFNLNVEFINSEEVLAYVESQTRSTDFSSLTDARQRLYRMMDLGYKLVEDTRDYRSGLDHLEEGHPRLAEWRIRQMETMAVYETWYAAYNRFCEKRPCDAESDFLASSCRMVYLTSVVWVSNCLETDETKWLNFLPEFQTVINEAEKMISIRSMRNVHFTFEAVSMVPLFLTAVKCRDLEVRYRALAAMRHSAYKEGLFKREEMLKIATRVVNLETRSDQVITGGFPFPENGIVFDARKVVADKSGTTRVAFRAKLGTSASMWASWEEDLQVPQESLLTYESADRYLQPGSIA